MIRHVVWDWNGTLLADQFAVLDALNVLLADLGRPATDMATYRRLYTRPVRTFYERLLERDIDDRAWSSIDTAFHHAYAEVVRHVDLDPQARDALATVATSGRRQSLLSMSQHDHLVEMVDHHDLGHHFDRVAGVRGVGGGHKADWLHAHLEALAIDDVDEVLVVGDALDDAVAAHDVGARVVLFASSTHGGSHAADDLASLGVPVVDSLAAALRHGGVTNPG